jgi:hypothetical protein
VFAAVLAAHSLSPVLTSGDSRWTVLVALSLLERGDTNLDEYLDLVRESGYYGVECVQDGSVLRGAAMGDCSGGHIYNWYPVGVPLMAAPVVLGIRAALSVASPALAGLGTSGRRPILDAFLRGDLVGGRAAVEMIAASWIVALAAAVLFLTARRFLPARPAAALALLFAFATPAWSTASRALYQHAPSMLLIAVTIHLLVAAERRARLAALAGLPAAFAYVVRPTNALLLAAVTGYIFHRHRRALPAFAACAAAVLGAFAAYNLSAFGSWLPSYYRLRPPAPGWGIWEALAGNLVSPSRGLLVFTPVFLFSLAGAAAAIRSGWLRPLPAYLAGWTATHLLAVSLYVSFWWGGYSYGPRLTSDLTPVLVFFLIPVLEAWRGSGWRWRPGQILFVVALAASLLIHAHGALSFAPHTWNTIPVSVDLRPERVWDWRDPQFLRGW